MPLAFLSVLPRWTAARREALLHAEVHGRYIASREPRNAPRARALALHSRRVERLI